MLLTVVIGVLAVTVAVEGNKVMVVVWVGSGEDGVGVVVNVVEVMVMVEVVEAMVGGWGLVW